MDERDLELEYPAMRYVSRLSVASWEISGHLPGSSLWLPPVRALMQLIRPGRVTMISLLTGVIAFVSNVPTLRLWMILLAGMFLAMTGFAVDMYTDRSIDKDAPRTWPVNPLSAGMMTPSAARRWIVFFVMATLAICAWVHPLTLVPAAALLGTYWGLSHGVFDRPIGRAITLGLIQALYVLLASAATGAISPVMGSIAFVLFVSMFGARAAADIRDLPHDRQTGTRTLATVHGIPATSRILPVATTLAAVIALYVHQLGAFDSDYLVWTLVAFVPAVAFAWSFALHPTPNYAFALSWPYWAIGAVYMLALVLGST